MKILSLWKKNKLLANAKNLYFAITQVKNYGYFGHFPLKANFLLFKKEKFAGRVEAQR